MFDEALRRLNEMRPISRVRFLVAAVVMVFLAPCAVAQQQDAKSLLAELGNRKTASQVIGSIERIAARIVYVETVALMSEHGKWPEELSNWPEDAEASKNVYDVKNLYSRMTPELVAIKRMASQGGVYAASETELLASMLGELQLMLDESQSLYALLKAEKLEEANLFFRDVVRARYEGILADSYTLGTGVTRDVSRIMLDVRRLD
jgi:hypothetical protein